MGPPEGSPDTDPVAAWLIAAEIALGRRDPAWPGGIVSLLDTAFVEVGASGRVWDRASMAEVLSVAGPSTLQFDAFAVHSLGGAVALVTYRTIDPVRIVWRASVWIRTEAGWRLRYHQGTVAGDAPALAPPAAPR